MKKALIVSGIVIALMGIMFYLVNWVILPALKRPRTNQPQSEEQYHTLCGNTTDITGDTVTWEQTETDELDGKTITIEGYPELPFIMMMENGRASVRLSARMNQGTGGLVMLLVEEGTCENTMLPLSGDYDQSDMIFMDNAGEEIWYGESMRVTGKVKINNARCTVSVEKIEKIELDYDYEKESVRLTGKNSEALNDRLVYAEGILSTPDEQEGLRLELFLEDESLPFIVNTMIAYGSLENQAADPGETYTSEDIAVFDTNGKIIKPGNKVRVYGVWKNEKSDLWVEKIVLLEK